MTNEDLSNIINQIIDKFQQLSEFNINVYAYLVKDLS